MNIKPYLLVAVLIMLMFGAFVFAQDDSETSDEETPAASEAEDNAAQAEDEAVAAASAPSGMVTGLRHLHSFVRWIIIVVTAAALVKLGLGFFQNAEYDQLASRLMIAFSALITIQWLIGIVFLVVYGGSVGFGFRHFWEHAAVMTVAVGLSHMHMRWKRSDAKVRYRNSLVIVVVVLVLVVIGISLLPYNAWNLMPAS